MNRIFLACALLFVAFVIRLAGEDWRPAVERPLTSEEMSQLKPEICSTSPLSVFSAIIPIAPRSVTRSMEPEQVALISESGGSSGWRKLWVLRLPATYVTLRPCDFGRQNWVGSGDSKRVSQHFSISWIIIGDQMLPAARTTKEQFEAGLPIEVSLQNAIRDSASRHRDYVNRVNDRLDLKAPLRCREGDSGIPRLVKFERIDPEDKTGWHCSGPEAKGSRWEKRMYGKKIDDLTYEFIIECIVNCRMYSDYEGWNMHVVFQYAHLQRAVEAIPQIRSFLARHTAHIDHADPSRE